MASNLGHNVTNAQPNSTPAASSEIWSSILNSVASSRATPTKNVILFGEPNVGKSTFLNFIRHENRVREKPVSGIASNGGLEAAPASSSEEEYFKRLEALPVSSKLALTHDFIDLKDGDSEDSLARINFYQLADPHPRYHKLANMALGPTQYGQSTAMIFLDWGRPWLFIESLQKWLRFLEIAHTEILDYGGDSRTVDDPDRYTTGKAMIEELKAQLVKYFQDYKDAPVGLGEEKRPAISALSETPIKIAPGCLSRNLGIPLIIVCTKSDKIKQVERDGDYTEGCFDYIQQILRTICLQYGATLIYTSIYRPNSFSLLRNYLLHRLFGVAGSATNDNPNNETSSTSNILPSYLNSFKVRGLIVERESVFVPSGWDSFNKIRVLRDGIQCAAIQASMVNDLAEQVLPYLPAHHQAKFTQTSEDLEFDPDETPVSLRKSYAETIKLPFSATRQAALVSDSILAQPEQAFLAAHFAMFQGMDSANGFPHTLPYVGTANIVVDRSSRGNESEPNTNSPASLTSPNASNSFFKKLAMKDTKS